MLKRTLYTSLGMALFLLFQASQVQAQGKGSCWTLAEKTNSKSNTIGFTQLYVKDTTVSIKGKATFAIVLALNNTKKEENVPLLNRIESGEFNFQIGVKITSPQNVTETVNFTLGSGSKGNILLFFDETFQEWKCEDESIEVKNTNLCGQTDHFRIGYTAGNTKLTAAAATYLERTKQGCKKQYKLNGLSITGSGISISGGNLNFKENSSFLASGNLDFGNTVVTAVWGTFIGRDGKGNSARFETEMKLNTNTGLLEGKAEIGKNFPGGFQLEKMQCTVINFCKDTTTLDGAYDAVNTKTSFAILLNGHKRPAKYGQCMIFSGKEKSNTVSFNLPDLYAQQTVAKDEKSGDVLFSSNIALDPEKENKATEFDALIAWHTITATLRVRYQDNDKNSMTVNIQPSYDATAGHYVFKNGGIVINGVPQWGMVALEMFVRNNCGDTVVLEGRIKSGANTGGSSNFHVWNEVWSLKQRFTDSCASNIDLRKPEASVTRVSGLYVISYSLTPAKNSDIPSYIIINTAIKNCRGDVKYIDVKLTYDAKSGTMKGALGYVDENDCKWNCEDITMKVYNECGKQVDSDAFPSLIIKMKDKIAKGDV